MANIRKVDYESIEPDWRAGIKSVSQLAEEYTKRSGIRVTHTAINKHFKKRGIPRDLSAKIKAKAEAKVSQSIVSGKVSVETIVEANAENIAGIDLSHRKDVQKAREIVNALLDELSGQAFGKDLYDELGELMQSSDVSVPDKLNDVFQKVISFSGRTDNMYKLANTLRILVELERKIVKLDEIAPEGQGNVNLIIRPI